MSDRTRVVVLSQLPPPVHGSTVMTELLVEVLGEDHDVDVVERTYSRTVSEVGKFAFRKLSAALGLFGRTLRAASRRPDVAVVFFTNRRFSFVSDLVCIAIFRSFRVPIVHYIHTVGFRSLADRGSVWRRLVVWGLQAARTVVVLGPSLASDISWAVDLKRIRYIANIPRHAPPELDVERKPQVLFLSNLIREKGADTFVDVAEIVGSQIPEAVFVLAGYASDASFLDHIQRRVKESPLGERLLYIGAVSGDHKWQVLMESSVLFFPSRYPFEAQPLTIVEAQTIGLAVVAFDTGGVRDLRPEFLLDRNSSMGTVAAAVVSAMNGPRAGSDPESILRTRRSEFKGSWAAAVDDAAR